MAVHIITAASSNTNTAIVDAATQAVLFVNADGFIEYGFGAAVQFTGGNSTLNIAGNVVGRSFNAINLGTSVVGLPDTGGSNWLHVSSSGSISALGIGVSAIDAFGGANTITNDGNIFGDTAIRTSGADNKITNAGVITAVSNGINAVIDDTLISGSILNSGQIHASTGISVAGGYHIVNSGTILTSLTGIELTGVGNTVQNTGMISSGNAGIAILSGAGPNTIFNSGTITASTGFDGIYSNDGNLSLDNSGSILGGVRVGQISGTQHTMT